MTSYLRRCADSLPACLRRSTPMPTINTTTTTTTTTGTGMDTTTTTNTGTGRGRGCGMRSPRTRTTSRTRSTPRSSRALRGIRAVRISLVGLGATAVLQLVIVAVSGSVALLADTIHNFSDALTAVPLWIAFVTRASRRRPALHLRLRPGRGPRRPLRPRDDRPLGRRRRLARPSTGCWLQPLSDNLGWVAVAGVRRLPRQRGSSPSSASARGAPSARPPSSPTDSTPAPTD